MTDDEALAAELRRLKRDLERSYDYELEDEFPELDEEDYPRD